MKFQIGYNTFFEVRKETYIYDDTKHFNVLYLSDFHFNGYSKNIIRRIAEKVNELNPEILLLGGDYADTKKGLFYFEEFLKSIAGIKNKFAIAGNHDYFFGIEKIKEVIVNNYVRWIEKDSFSFKLNGIAIRVDGNKFTTKEKQEFCILCLHKPLDIQKYVYQYNLVFAGHLHGGQVILWQTKKGMYPGRLFYRWNLLKKDYNSCLYLISKGLGDTLPIRYNCSKDIVYVSVS